MQTKLCIETFELFIEALQANSLSVEQVVHAISQNFSLLTMQFPIGRCELMLHTAQTMLDPMEHTETFLLYSTASIGLMPYQNEGKAQDGSHALMTYWATADEEFTEEQKASLRFVSRNIFFILEKAAIAHHMEAISLTDLMTGVANTKGLMEIGERLFRQGLLREYSCIFLNIKNFNYINQMVGSPQGDLVLRQFAQLVRSYLMEDEHFGRLGGDNFLALVHKDRTETVVDFIHSLRLSLPHLGSYRSFEITSRIGICPFQPDQRVGDAMASAAAALGVARSGTKGDVVWFHRRMLESSLHAKEISLLFSRAIQNQEFVVYYQPKVTLRDNHLCGCEALVRWLRNGQVVPPAEFIPVLEREGTVCRLDFYVLEAVCRDLQSWIAQGIEPVSVSVNFSKLHLHNANFATDILETLSRYHISHDLIEVELTETSGYEDYQNLSVFVQKMHSNGVRTSIDDFGTGYSSLNLLKDLQVDIIKLDKSFLNHIEAHSRSDEIVIRNIVNMVNELNMEIIAEGVETKEQVDFLRQIHCLMAQGYLFDQPLPREAFEERLRLRTYQIDGEEPQAAQT